MHINTYMHFSYCVAILAQKSNCTTLSSYIFTLVFACSVIGAPLMKTGPTEQLSHPEMVLVSVGNMVLALSHYVSKFNLNTPC